MIALFTVSPTLIALAIMWGSALLQRPIGIERVGWLLTGAQLFFLVVGVVATLLAKKSERAMPAWRIAANKWVGRLMAVVGLFYAIAFALVAHHGP